MNVFKSTTLTSVFILLFFIVGLPAHSGKVVKVKKKLVVIKLSKKEARRYKPNLILNAYTKRGKKRGQIKILKIRKRKAVGRILSGKVKRSYFVKRASKKRKKITRRRKKGASKNYEITNDDSSRNTYLGVLTGMSQNTLETIFAGNPKTLTGSSTGIKMFYDWPLWDSIWVRLSGGLQPFTVDGGCPTECKVNISYITFDGLMKYMISKNKWRFWVGGFFSALVPMSVDDSTVLNKDSIATTSNFGGALGLDYALSDSYMIPLSVGYGLFPDGPDSKSNAVTVSIGFGFKW